MRRSTALRIAVIAAIAFILNWLWEMLQMPAYQEMAHRSWAETARICTIATLGDVAATLGVYGIGALAARDPRWGLRDNWHVYGTAAILGAGIATGIEWHAMSEGAWSYTDLMPMVPLLDVGLLPWLQLTILIPASLWFGARFGATVAPKQ